MSATQASLPTARIALAQAHKLGLRDQAFYLWSAAFIIGGLALPQLCHLASLGGKIFLPIYFFTLIAACRCGWRIGVLTALAAPLLNSALFGMPPAAVLPAVLVKSLLIAILAPLALRACGYRYLPALLLTVIGYQALGGLFEWIWTGNLAAALQDARLGWPGMVVQVGGGWLVLRILEKQFPVTVPTSVASPADGTK